MMVTEAVIEPAVPRLSLCHVDLRPQWGLLLGKIQPQ